MAKQKSQLPIEWDSNARARFKKLVKNIRKRSAFLAQRIKYLVKENIDHIKQNPEIFEADTLKTNNDGTYRKFIAIHIRVVYKIDPDKIIIARVSHASSDPIEY